ncbi:MAG: protein kinase [Sandaracinaceae bacterium]|nr:protein kinase [Sandaracinaceae bacterium]
MCARRNVASELARTRRAALSCTLDERAAQERAVAGHLRRGGHGRTGRPRAGRARRGRGPLPPARAHRRGRHGRGLPRRARAQPQEARAQGRAPLPLQGPPGRRALPPRGERGRGRSTTRASCRSTTRAWTTTAASSWPWSCSRARASAISCAASGPAWRARCASWRGMLEPLAKAHAKGFVHRDLKPDNVFLTEEEGGRERVKILDFGLAREVTKGGPTRTGITFGTPEYMSPEQAMSARKVRAPGDVWSVGVMLYELLSGTHPFSGETPNAIMANAIKEPLPRSRRRRRTSPPSSRA